MIKSKTSSIQRALLGTLLAASAAMAMPAAAYSDMVTGWNEITIQTFPPTVLGPTQARFLAGFCANRQGVLIKADGKYITDLKLILNGDSNAENDVGIIKS